MELLYRLGVALGLLRPSSASPGPAKAASQRGLARKRQRMQDGFVSSEGMLTPRACTVWDMTALGGRVEIWDHSVKPALLRGRLTLYLPGDRKEVECAVVWRRENALGLKFMSPLRAPTRSYT